MKKQPEHDLLEVDTFDVLSAAWVMACNDENSMITYESIRSRLNLSQSFDIKGLIHRRADLFRRTVPTSRLETWKHDMRAGKRSPAWIREITEDDLRRKTIDELTTQDVFRSQFRAEDAAPKSSLEVMDWGLQHIDRLRKASYEAREKSAKSWQMWLVFWIGVLNVAATIIVALLKKP
jgi:hypothetical protein